jgi:hypothetical protein
VVVTAANITDTTMFQAVLVDVPPVLTPSGRRRCRPGELHGDKGYGSAANRAYLRVVGSGRGSRGAGSSRLNGWGGTGGGWSGRCRR